VKLWPEFLEMWCDYIDRPNKYVVIMRFEAFTATKYNKIGWKPGRILLYVVIVLSEVSNNIL
jgi:hypothetical protein